MIFYLKFNPVATSLAGSLLSSLWKLNLGLQFFPPHPSRLQLQSMRIPMAPPFTNKQLIIQTNTTRCEVWNPAESLKHLSASSEISHTHHWQNVTKYIYSHYYSTGLRFLIFFHFCYFILSLHFILLCCIYVIILVTGYFADYRHIRQKYKLWKNVHTTEFSL